jgi:hypothetical protein
MFVNISQLLWVIHTHVIPLFHNLSFHIPQSHLVVEASHKINLMSMSAAAHNWEPHQQATTKDSTNSCSDAINQVRRSTSLTAIGKFTHSTDIIRGDDNRLCLPLIRLESIHEISSWCRHATQARTLRKKLVAWCKCNKTIDEIILVPMTQNILLSQLLQLILSCSIALNNTYNTQRVGYSWHYAFSWQKVERKIITCVFKSYGPPKNAHRYEYFVWTGLLETTSQETFQDYDPATERC